MSTSDFLLLAVSIVLASSLGDTVFFESSQGVAVGTVLSSTAPMWALLFGSVGFGDRLPPIAVAGLVITVLGIIVLQL